MMGKIKTSQSTKMRIKSNPLLQSECFQVLIEVGDYFFIVPVSRENPMGTVEITFIIVRLRSAQFADDDFSSGSGGVYDLAISQI